MRPRRAPRAAGSAERLDRAFRVELLALLSDFEKRHGRATRRAPSRLLDDPGEAVEPRSAARARAGAAGAPAEVDEERLPAHALEGDLPAARAAAVGRAVAVVAEDEDVPGRDDLVGPLARGEPAPPALEHVVGRDPRRRRRLPARLDRRGIAAVGLGE